MDLRLLSLRCKLYFDHLLRLRACSGKILFDHKNETLSITVSYFILLIIMCDKSLLLFLISPARTCIAKDRMNCSPLSKMWCARMLLKTSKNKKHLATLYGLIARNTFGLSSYAEDKNSLTSHPSHTSKITHSYFHWWEISFYLCDCLMSPVVILNNF